jgi:hypothetical protein
MSFDVQDNLSLSASSDPKNTLTVLQGIKGDLVVVPGEFVGTNTAAMVVKSNGKVGIGTSQPDPNSMLDITGFAPILSLSDTATGQRAMIQGAGGDFAVIPQSFIGTNTAAMVVKSNGKVGIGTSQPDPNSMLDITGFAPILSLSDSETGKRAMIQGAGGDFAVIPQSFIGTNTAALVVKNSGDVTMAGTLTVAQDIVLSGGDCAEHFDVLANSNLEPGTVTVICDDGSLAPSSVPYDKRVAGVVSGAGGLYPGIVLDKQESDGLRLPIALVGKVYCRVDARFTPIEVGDLLTTSETLGHAMKAADQRRAFGAVLGKALRAHSEGTGLIPILVALQ